MSTSTANRYWIFSTPDENDDVKCAELYEAFRRFCRDVEGMDGKEPSVDTLDCLPGRNKGASRITALVHGDVSYSNPFAVSFPQLEPDEAFLREIDFEVHEPTMRNPDSGYGVRVTHVPTGVSWWATDFQQHKARFKAVRFLYSYVKSGLTVLPKRKHRPERNKTFSCCPRCGYPGPPTVSRRPQC